ncbi:MAG: sigma-70 family RNA polymerase sigma factor [Solirubrobacterales bacterium]|nr:sigma-70 family RNA polymerase sigma factor [Solirubrobacterales bacterium]
MSEESMEASAITQSDLVGLRAPSAFLRLQSDEKLVTLTRRGNQSAYEALVGRYHTRILGFTRHMLASKEDAEDVTQESFAAAYSAMMADERAINVKPWLYRIARNRSLNHLRRQTAIGVDDFDHHVANHGRTTEDEVGQREDLRQLMTDVRDLPESQRTALLLREIDALSYDQIAEAMETTVPSVKSLLVRARGGLAEAAEARQISCEEVRIELAEVAEGLTKLSPPVRRHTRECERCKGFQATLKQNNKALAMLLPIGPLLVLKKLVLAHLGTTASAGGTATATAGGGLFSGAVGTVATKAAATMAAAAIVTTGAVEVNKATTAAPTRESAAAITQSEPATVASVVPAPKLKLPAEQLVDPAVVPVVVPVVAPVVDLVPAVIDPAPAPEPTPVVVEEHHDDVTITPPVVDLPPAPPVVDTPPAPVAPPVVDAPVADAPVAP